MARAAAPQTHYARSGDVNIAYQVVGEGPIDLVFVWGVISHVEMGWEIAPCARFLGRLASFARLIHFDKRGTGLSDPVQGVPTLEQRMDDVRAVMDAAGSERAALVGVSEGSQMAALFAATYPERTTHLVIYGGYSRILKRSDDDWGYEPEVVELSSDYLMAHWGEGAMALLIAPSKVGDERFVRELGRLERASSGPGMFRQLVRLNASLDMTDMLPSITVPTLVLHRSEVYIPLQAGRELAAAIPGARFVELSGEDHFFFVDPDQIVDEIEEFVTGTRHAPEPDRVLATVLFTDIVASTERAAELGDARWRALLEDHDAFVRRELEHFRGREVKTVGDGFLATFDGPARAIRCATAIGEAAGALGIEMRAGLHTGECELRGDDIGGIAVHIAARVAARARPGDVLISRTVKDLVFGSDIEFEARGTQSLRGVPGEWPLFAVTDV